MYRTGRTPSDHGFTLLELLVAMALLSIVSVLMLAWLPSVADRVAVDQSARQIDRALSHAAVQAKSTGSDQIAVFSLSGRTPTLIAGDRTIALDPSIEMTWLAASELGSNSERSAIVFLATGGASGGSVTLGRGEARSRIAVDWLTGNTRREAVSDDRP
jgi:type II secretion system protein H